MSTATDLGAPATEQGAGRIDALAAVNAALSLQDWRGTPKPRGAGVLSSADQRARHRRAERA